MTFLIRQTHGGRCPACGAQHAVCGPPSGVTPVDIPTEEVTAVSGPLRKYHFTSPSGAETILKLNDADAAAKGLTDADLVDAPEPSAAAGGPAGKARTASLNKARTRSANKGAGGGD